MSYRGYGSNRISGGGSSIVVDANGVTITPVSGQDVTMVGNLIFTDATYDIGASGATRPRDLFLSNDVTFAGQALGPIGSVSSPTFSNTGSTNTGMYFTSSGNRIAWATSGSRRLQLVNENIQMESNTNLNWASDVSLNRDAADVLAQRRTTNVQIDRLYGTFTDSSNYERLARTTAAGDYLISPEAAGTGTLRGLQVVASGGRLGFYGSTAVALQTGVAVSAAGVHGALVNLNLITA